MDDSQTRLLNGFRVVTWIGIIEQLSRNQAVRALKPLKLGFPEFSMLNHFSHGNPARKTVTLIASAMQQTQPTVTKTVQRLLAKGFLAASSNKDDGRSKFLTMTAKGQAIYAKGIALFGPLIGAAFEAWSDDELAAFFRQLDRLKVYLDDNRPSTDKRG